MWGGRRKDRGRYLVQITCVNFMITGFVLQAWVRVCGGVQSSDLESSFANAQAQFWQRGGEWCEVEIASLFKTPRHNRTLIYKTLYIQSTCDVPGTWNILLLTFFHSVRHEIHKLKESMTWAPLNTVLQGCLCKWLQPLQQMAIVSWKIEHLIILHTWTLRYISGNLGVPRTFETLKNSKNFRLIRK